MSKIYRKRGVTLNGVQPETVLAIQLAATIVEDLGGRFVITSLTDGKEWRSPNSLHVPGLAFDVRIWDFPTQEDQLNLVEKLREALGGEFDVVLESDHIHIEFDPKPASQLQHS